VIILDLVFADPETIPRYAGSNGRTHGLKNETKPASKAMGAATHNGPKVIASKFNLVDPLQLQT
jgi:hypothetical protein